MSAAVVEYVVLVTTGKVLANRVRDFPSVQAAFNFVATRAEATARATGCTITHPWDGNRYRYRKNHFGDIMETTFTVVPSPHGGTIR